MSTNTSTTLDSFEVVEISEFFGEFTADECKVVKAVADYSHESVHDSAMRLFRTAAKGQLAAIDIKRLKKAREQCAWMLQRGYSKEEAMEKSGLNDLLG